MTGTREHWQSVFSTRADDEVSWYRPRLNVSLEWIEAAAPDRSSAVIDVGSGSSSLPDALLDLGYTDITLLDVSEAALARARARLAGRKPAVKWIAADVTRWTPARQWYLWHDRAAFHFQIHAEQQDAYIAALTAATVPGGWAIIATFALDGPERCSGLPVQRYSPETLAARLGGDFELVAGKAEDHVTPKGAIQRFSYALLRRR